MKAKPHVIMRYPIDTVWVRIYCDRCGTENIAKVLDVLFAVNPGRIDCRKCGHHNIIDAKEKLYGANTMRGNQLKIAQLTIAPE